jgi:hypothetical protein
MSVAGGPLGRVFRRARLKVISLVTSSILLTDVALHSLYAYSSNVVSQQSLAIMEVS